MSTTDEAEVRRLGQKVRAKGGFPMDSPVSGGYHRAATGNIVIFTGGERTAFEYEFARVLEHQAASILQPALGRVGGILEAKKIAGMAETYYAQIAPHLYCGPVEGAANIQLATCTPNFLILEGIQTWGGFHADILKKPVQWQDGYVIPLPSLGWGWN